VSKVNVGELEAIVADFRRVAAIAGMHLDPSHIACELLSAPHRRPSRLPSGKTAVYAFILGPCCLKVGKAGPKSQARFTSQHYSPGSSMSNLASSVISGRDRLEAALPPELHGLLLSIDEDSIGRWIEHNCARAHVFLEASLGDGPLSLLEAFVQCRLRPLYEGKTA
jgi:hypothetical protein